MMNSRRQSITRLQIRDKIGAAQSGPCQWWTVIGLNQRNATEGPSLELWLFIHLKAAAPLKRKQKSAKLVQPSPTPARPSSPAIQWFHSASLDPPILFILLWWNRPNTAILFTTIPALLRPQNIPPIHFSAILYRPQQNNRCFFPHLWRMLTGFHAWGTVSEGETIDARTYVSPGLGSAGMLL